MHKKTRKRRVARLIGAVAAIILLLGSVPGPSEAKAVPRKSAVRDRWLDLFYEIRKAGSSKAKNGPEADVPAQPRAMPSKTLSSVRVPVVAPEIAAREMEITEAVRTPAAGASSASDYVLEETGSMARSQSGEWWLNSGAYVYFSDGIGRTVSGNLPAEDKWRTIYAFSNPEDTDEGFRPQNIFRLVNRSVQENSSQEAYFRINKYNDSDSAERQGYNGVLFFLRYKDGDNLYYAGLRADGMAVIKKKSYGKYATLASSKVFEGRYDRDNNPNLMPIGSWFGMRAAISGSADGSAVIRLYADTAGNGSWKMVAEAIDRDPLNGSGHGGIRTDFADVEFRGYGIVAGSP